MTCDGTLKNGTPCGKKSLPGYSRCGRHGGTTVDKCLLNGDLDSLKHIIISCNVKLTDKQMLSVCQNKKTNIVQFLISDNNTRKDFVKLINLVCLSGSYLYAWFLPLIDNFYAGSIYRNTEICRTGDGLKQCAYPKKTKKTKKDSLLKRVLKKNFEVKQGKNISNIAEVEMLPLLPVV